MRNKLFVVLSLLDCWPAWCWPPALPQPLPPLRPEVVKETVVVEKETVEGVETVVITATPEPDGCASPKPPVLRVNIGTYPDIIDPQKSSFVNEIAHLQMIYEGLTNLG